MTAEHHNTIKDDNGVLLEIWHDNLDEPVSQCFCDGCKSKREENVGKDNKV